VYSAFAGAFFEGAIRMFQRDNEMRNIVLSDPEARGKATRHFFTAHCGRPGKPLDL